MNALIRSLVLAALIAPATRVAADPVPADRVPAPPRERLRMDSGWRFALGHPSDPARDFDHATRYFSYLAKAGFGDGPADPSFDDRAWRQLDLPHDWAVELPFDGRGTASHGFKAIGRNFPENSVAWYRRTFSIPASDLGRRISIEFDGVYRDAAVWINGFYLGREPSGYLGFRHDLTDYLNYGGENVVAVRVDATMEEGWFYEGAGIYRHVWLTKTAPLHVGTDGTAITTDPGEDVARVATSTAAVNDGTADVTFDLEQVVLDAQGRVVASGALRGLTLAAGLTREFDCNLAVPQPRLWSIETPVRYRLVTTIRSGGAMIDRCETAFGIRSIRFDPDRGFFLNGRRVELKGVNMHQDHAGLGVALPDAIQDYRVARLMEIGVNAWRCAHNPPTPELLDACDRLGVVVIDENRLMGSGPAQLNQLERLIRRDRNHPSVILWSIGNEEWAIEGNIKGARIAATMQAFARRIDPSRRVVAAISGGWGGISTTIDVVGYNYINQSDPDDQHARFPHQPGVGTEETTTQQTRGVYVDDRPNAHLSPQARGDSGGNCERGWTYYAARPFLAGLFFWTGFDYRGEPTPFGWPAISSQMGLLDTCGFRKDGSYYLEAWWTDHPVLHLYPHWNWPGREGQEIKVVCTGNQEAVELLLNGVSLGKQPMPPNGHLEWTVAYRPGTLEARGTRGGKVVATTRVDTTGAPARLSLAPDRAAIAADGADVAVFTVSALDAAGRLVPTAGNAVEFEVSGGRIIGLGNGDPACHEPDQVRETLALVPVEDWRGRLAGAGTAAPGAPDSLEPFPVLGHWRAPLPRPGQVYDLAGTFALAAVPDRAALDLFLPSFGSRTTVWLNGRLLARDLDTASAGPGLKLDPAQLVAGQNRVQLIVAPFADGRNHIPEQLTRLGALRIATPAAPARRSLFNGLAQVIVQAGREPGPIRLRARADGLAPAEATVAAEAAAARPAVP